MEKNMDFIKDLGYLAVGTRMKRLTDRLMKGAGEVYKTLGIDFEPRYFAVFYLLSRSVGPLSISQIASALKISHPAVIQTTKLLLKKKLIVSAQDDFDRRKRLLTLSTKGLRMAENMQPIWDDFVAATCSLFEDTGVDILDSYQKIEDALDKKGIAERILGRIKASQYSALEIVDYRPEFKEDFKRLNEDWLKEFFEIEERDRQVLENPQEEILNKGGFVFFVLSRETVVGTAALFKVNEKTFELAKMAVEPSFRGKQAGRKLADAAIAKALREGAEAIILWTDIKLHEALSLYASLGFTPIKPDDYGPYTRTQSGIMMRLTL